MHILLSTSFHANLEALAGFHQNWRAALAGRMTTLAHLSANTRQAMLESLSSSATLPSATGLLLNPISIATSYGTALPMLIHNHATALRMGLDPTHIMLASPYLYAFQPGLDRSVADHDCGLPDAIYPLNPTWHWHAQAQADPRLTALAGHLGVSLRIGRADGVFLTRALFEEMLAVLLRFFHPSEIATLDPIYPLEEVVFPTLLPALLGTAGRIAATGAKVWEPDDPVTVEKLQVVLSAGVHRCGKRIPQVPEAELRRMVLAALPGVETLHSQLGTTLA